MRGEDFTFDDVVWWKWLFSRVISSFDIAMIFDECLMIMNNHCSMLGIDNSMRLANVIWRCSSRVVFE